MASAISAIAGLITRMKPKVEATPLPPLNFSQTGKLWPMMAAVPAYKAATRLVEVKMPAKNMSSAGTKRSASQAAKPALEASSRTVSRARSLRPVRSTLVAPMLPEPILRMSPRPASLVTTRPKGTEPSR